MKSSKSFKKKRKRNNSAVVLGVDDDVRAIPNGRNDVGDKHSNSNGGVKEVQGG